MIDAESAIIVAVDECYGFGKDGKIPWHFKEDFQYFKKMTKGATCVMGRKTYEDLLGYAKTDELLPGRKCYVVTSSEEPLQKGAKRLSDPYEDLPEDCVGGPVFYIGGAGIFDAALDFVDEVYMTHIRRNYDCDVSFPYAKLEEKFQLADNPYAPVLDQELARTLLFERWVRK
nr:Dihydrofolate reductase [uncultured bacterium]